MASNGTQTAVASITLLPPPSVAITPAQVQLLPSQVQQFIVTYSALPSGVQWSISPSVGVITQSGQYTAPGTVAEDQAVTIKAISTSIPSVTASATVMLAPGAPQSPELSPGPQIYNAISDTVPRAEGPAPMLGPANSVYIDPDFGTRVLRVSDQNAIPGDPYVDVEQVANWQTPFSADSSKFFISSGRGETVFYSFDPVSFTASLIMDPNHPSQPLPLPGIFVNGFSYQNPNIVYGMTGGLTSHNLVQYDFSKNTTAVIAANIDSFLPAQSQNWSGYSPTVYNDYYDVNFAVGDPQPCGRLQQDQ